MRSLPKLVVVLVAACLVSSACIVVPEQPPEPPRMEPPPPPPAPAVEGDVGLFYDELAPYGPWYWTEPWGWVWTPARVPYEWRPYTMGRWVYTEYGWTWDTFEDWGWATYHYGRWLLEPRLGWVWVPGDQWGPAWVAWRYGDGWVGWAPLPPQVGWRAGYGLDPRGFDLDRGIQPGYWSFVEMRDLFEPGIDRRLAPAPRNVTIINITRNVTNITIIENRIVNNSIAIDRIERDGGRRVPRVRTIDQRSPRDVRGGHDDEREVREVRVFRPVIVKGKLHREPPEFARGDADHPRVEGDHRTAPAEPVPVSPAPPAQAPPSTPAKEPPGRGHSTPTPVPAERTEPAPPASTPPAPAPPKPPTQQPPGRVHPTPSPAPAEQTQHAPPAQAPPRTPAVQEETPAEKTPGRPAVASPPPPRVSPGSTKPVPAPAVSAEILKRQEDERKRLDDRHAAERADLQGRQTRELAGAQARPSRDEMTKRHTAESKALLARQQQERQALRQKQQKEKEGKMQQEGKGQQGGGEQNERGKR